MTADLQIRLLGGLHLTRASLPLTDFVSNKAPALLAYLAVTRRPHSREALAALLWGELSDADAKNNLRQALSSLRRLLDPYLLITRDSVALNPEAALFLDTEAFEAFLRAGHLPLTERAARLQEAVALYQDDFLAGFAVRDAPEFEEWTLAQRARLRELALHALHSLTQFHLQRGDSASAIDAATRLLALDAWREEAHRQLMLALARSGQRSAALAQYETCRKILEKELGVKPSAETTALGERIRAAKRVLHLPPAATPFVGRAEALAHIAHLLADPTCRLVTFIGPGGSGKTRLALEAAARSAEAFLHGVCFVPLAAVSSLDVIPSAVAEVLGLALSGKADPRDQLLAHLRDKELLLVLDNLEHLSGADGWVGRLAQACPEVRLLVTSRERLNLHGERLMELGGLDLPSGADSPAANFSAAQLFLNSARNAQPEFALDSANEAAVIRICRLVEGLPLGIELAAAWVRHLNCREIAAEIEQSLDFLATTQKNVPARHRSLQAAFEHSWALLSEEERRAFARLSVFRGGCDRDAALAVTQCPLSALAALCDKSLLRRDPAGRYVTHELLRQYAEGKLRAEPQALAETQAQHGEHYIRFLSAREDALGDARQDEARRAIATEADNIRAAWAWAVNERRVASLQPAFESLRVFLEHAGWYVEAVQLFGAAAEVEQASGGAGGLLHAQLQMRQAWFYHRRDQFEMARPLIQHSLTIFHEAQPPQPAEAALCLQCLGNMARAVGDFTQAIEHCQQSLSQHRAVGNPRYIASSLNGLAVALTEQGNLEDAQQLHAESLALRREIGDRKGIATTLVNLVNITLTQGQYAEAQSFGREALAIFREIGYPMGVAVALNNVGIACDLLGEYAAAEPLFRECVTLCRELGHRHIATHALVGLGTVVGALGGHREAWHHIREALQIAQEVGSISALLNGLMGAATLLAKNAERERAAEIAALVLQQTAANQQSKNRAARLLAELEAQLPAPALAAAQERGRGKNLNEAVAEVLAISTSS